MARNRVFIVSFAFSARQGLILVRAEVTGPLGSAVLRLALDTGATRTVLHSRALASLGYNPDQAANHVKLTTGSGVVRVAVVKVARLCALGMNRAAMQVLAHPLPASANIDGVLGLDFFRRKVLRIDFQKGKIDVAKK